MAEMRGFGIVATIWDPDQLDEETRAAVSGTEDHRDQVMKELRERVQVVLDEYAAQHPGVFACPPDLTPYY